jgi:L-threonylcarbamoyladenylate synthase
MAIISNCTASIIKDAALALKQGHLVAFPTETVYGLGADATNEKAVARIYEVKGRPTDHPLIVHISSINNLDKWAKDIPEYAVRLARAFWPGPMTLILPRTPLAKDFITGGQNNVGIRVPVQTVARALLREFEALGGQGIAAPSANRFGKVSPTTADHVNKDLESYLKKSDLILNGGSALVGIESTIINCTQSQPKILRPGAITASMISEMLDLNHELEDQNLSNQIRTSGLLKSHYTPIAQVILNEKPLEGDGLIAPLSHATPSGVIRLASPSNNEEYARVLYHSLREADRKNLKRICVVTPENIGIGQAINDRLNHASTNDLE